MQSGRPSRPRWTAERKNLVSFGERARVRASVAPRERMVVADGIDANPNANPHPERYPGHLDGLDKPRPQGPDSSTSPYPTMCSPSRTVKVAPGTSAA